LANPYDVKASLNWRVDGSDARSSQMLTVDVADKVARVDKRLCRVQLEPV